MAYRDALLRTIDGWNADLILDEWLFENFRAGTVKAMSASEAFDIMLHEPDESTSLEVLITVLALASQSDTTEVPDMLLIHKDHIQEKFALFGGYANSKLQELFRYYRI